MYTGITVSGEKFLRESVEILLRTTTEESKYRASIIQAFLDGKIIYHKSKSGSIWTPAHRDNTTLGFFWDDYEYSLEGNTMTMVKTRIEVMQHFADGGKIEFRRPGPLGTWEPCENPKWNWEVCNYRKAPHEVYTEYTCSLSSSSVLFLNNPGLRQEVKYKVTFTEILE
jgi:hypothetical protein